ncbi:hypothetical protein [Streptomyces sp. NPDC002676]
MPSVVLQGAPSLGRQSFRLDHLDAALLAEGDNDDIDVDRVLAPVTNANHGSDRPGIHHAAELPR